MACRISEGLDLLEKFQINPRWKKFFSYSLQTQAIIQNQPIASQEESILLQDINVEPNISGLSLNNLEEKVVMYF